MKTFLKGQKNIEVWSLPQIILKMIKTLIGNVQLYEM